MNASDFRLHPQLQADCHFLGQFEECLVLLHRNAVLPWFILVPITSDQDLLDLPTEQRNRVMAESAQIAKFLRAEFGLTKLNFGAIGNLVPQMHLHIIGRSPEDACWPNPVWDNLTHHEEYEQGTIDALVRKLNSQYSLKL